MKRSRTFAVLAVAAAVAGLAAYAARLWHQRQRAAIALSGVSAIGDLGRWPAPFREEVARLSADVARSPDPREAIEGLAILYCANGFSAQSSLALSALERLEPREARWPYLLADARLRVNDKAGALAALEASAAIDPSYVPGLRRRADVLDELGRGGEARALLEKAASIEPGNAAVRYDLIGIEGRQGQRVRQGLEDLERAHPEVKAFHEDLARVLSANGDEAGAAREHGLAAQCEAYVNTADPWLDALDMDCYDTDRMTVRSVELRREGRFLELEALMKRVIDLAPFEPVNPVAWDLLAHFYLKEGRMPEARQLAEKGVALFPDEPQLRVLQVQILCHSQLPAEGVVAAEEAVRRWPDRADVLECLGVAQRDKGDVGNALETLHLALKRDATRTELYYEVGTCLVALGKRGEAHASFERALEMRPDYEVALYADGMIDLEEGNVLAAEPRVRRFNELRPSDPSARRLNGSLHLLKGAAAARAGDLGEADRQFQAGLEADPDYALLLHAVGDLALQRQHWKEAADDFTRYVHAQPDDPDGYVSQAAAYHRAGLAAEANAALEQGLKAAQRAGDTASAAKIVRMLGHGHP
jgi:tetratricopeptide (TPR) repeat protein